MARRTRDLYLVILLAVLANSVLWLDSLDRYLNGRYHVYLSQYLPDQAFTPSRMLHEAMLPDEHPDDAVTIIASAYAAKMVAPQSAVPAVQPAMAEASGIQPVSAVLSVASEVLPVSAVAAASAPPAVAMQRETASAVQVEGAQTVVTEHAPPRVLFAGDSMMQGVAPMVISHIRRAYPKGVYVDLSKPSTGLVARRYFDWPAKIREESIKNDIRVIVMFLGPNDPWDIYEGKKRYAFPSDAWEEKYRGRVDEVLDFARANGIRVIWVGLPGMREDRIRQGAKIENRIFQEETRKYKFEFLPTEDFLGGVDAPYSKYIEDSKKGKQAVRLDDGVHFTLLGLRMISSHLNGLLQEVL